MHEPLFTHKKGRKTNMLAPKQKNRLGYTKQNNKFVYALKGRHLSSDYKNDQPIELANPSEGELCL